MGKWEAKKADSIWRRWQCTANSIGRQHWSIPAELSEDGGLELSGLKCTCKGGIRILCAPDLYYAFPTQAIPSSVSQEELWTPLFTLSLQPEKKNVILLCWGLPINLNNRLQNTDTSKQVFQWAWESGWLSWTLVPLVWTGIMGLPALSLTKVPLKWTQTFMLAIPFWGAQRHFRNLSWVSECTSISVRLCVSWASDRMKQPNLLVNLIN